MGEGEYNYLENINDNERKKKRAVRGGRSIRVKTVPPVSGIERTWGYL